MTEVQIYRPAKTAMQSGPAGNASEWVLEFSPQAVKRADNLMGWLGSTDTASQVHIKFDTAEDAVEYAKRHGLSYVLQPELKHGQKIKNYADNFKFDKPEFGRF